MQERELVALSERYVRRFEEAVNAQIAMMNCSDPHARVLLSIDILASMQDDLTDSRTDHLKTVSIMVRRLRLDLLGKYAERGALLLKASKLSDVLYRTVQKEFNITRAQADECILMHQRWHDFGCAERWAWAAWHLPPDTPRDALSLIARWHDAGRPEPN